MRPERTSGASLDTKTGSHLSYDALGAPGRRDRRRAQDSVATLPPTLNLRLALPMGATRQFAAVICAYGCNALVTLCVVILLRRAVSPDLLREVLAFYFVGALASGLEPGTVKAEVLRAGEGGQIDARAVLVVDALKALAAAPLLALIWRFVDPGASFFALLAMPLVAFAGFAATDLRVVFDVRTRHAVALWLKQGSLALGFVIVGTVVGVGGTLATAVILASLPRIGLVVLVAWRLGRGGPSRRLGPRLYELLTEPRWLALMGASVIGALGGGVDRVFGLRMLPPVIYGAYFLVYEVFARFALIPYLLTPVIFARRAAGLPTEALIRGAGWLVLVMGAGFLLVVAGAWRGMGGLLDHWLGAHLGPAVLAFAAAMVINALAQLKVTQLQASDRTRAGFIAVAGGAVAASVLFYVMTARWGVTGLMLAWPLKCLVELAIAYGLDVRPKAQAALVSKD